MNFYFSINDRRAFDRSFIIRPEDAFTLNLLIKNNILPWYFGGQQKKIFSFVGNELKITGQFQEVVYARNEYAFLRFQPCVYRFEDGTYKEGIRMFVSSQDTFVDMEIDKFLGFYYLLTTTDMYTAAAAVVAYAKMPPYGINKFSMGLAGAASRAIDNPDAFRNDVPFNPQSNQKFDNKETNDFFTRTNKSKSKLNMKSKIDKKEDQ